MLKKNGLGRGLDSLLSENVSDDSNQIYEINIFDIEPNPDQPRKNFDEAALKKLGIDDTFEFTKLY